MTVFIVWYFHVVYFLPHVYQLLFRIQVSGNDKCQLEIEPRIHMPTLPLLPLEWYFWVLEIDRRGLKGEKDL